MRSASGAACSRPVGLFLSTVSRALMDFSTLSRGSWLTPWACRRAARVATSASRKIFTSACGEDHGADVPPLHQHVPAAGDLPKPVVHDASDLGNAGVGRHPFVHRIRVDALLDAAAVEGQAGAFHVQPARASRRKDAGRVSRRLARLQHGEGDGAIEAARVHVQEPCGFRAPPGNGAFPDPRRPINRCYHDRKTT